MRILTVASSYPRDADDFAGRFVRTPLVELARRGHQVTVVHPSSGDVAVEACEAGIRREMVRSSVGPSSLAYRGGMPEQLARGPAAWIEAPILTLALARRVRRLAREHDVVLSHWAVPGGWVGSMARLPHVCVLHSGGVHLLARLPLGRRLAARIAHGATELLAVSEFVRDRFLALLRTPLAESVSARTAVIRNALPRSGFEIVRAPRRGRVRLGFLGRLERVKGVDVLLDAIHRDDPFDLDIAGDGAERESLERRATGLPVRFLGRVGPSERRQFLGSIDALVLPSRVLRGGRTESAPLVIAEAHAAGVPVVGTRVGGVPECVEPGRTGLLVPPDDPESLRAALLAIAGSRPDQWEEACRRAAGAHRPDRVADDLERRLERAWRLGA